MRGARSRSRRGAAGALWAALRSARRPGSPRTGVLVRALPRMVTATMSGEYTGLSRSRLGLMALAALYIASPVDLVPEVALLAVGVLDDAVVLSWLAGTVLSETEAFLAWEKGDRRGGAREPGGRGGTGGGSTGGWGGWPGRPGGSDRGPRRPPSGPDVVPGEVIR